MRTERLAGLSVPGRASRYRGGKTLPANRSRATAGVSRSCAAASVAPVAHTVSTRPPAARITPSASASVPAWNT